MGKRAKAETPGPLRLVGVDPGITASGVVGFVRNEGGLTLAFSKIIIPGRKGTAPERLARLASEVLFEVTQLEPDVVLIEENIRGRGRGRRNMHRLLEATGAIAAMLAQDVAQPCEVIFQKPDTLKKPARHERLIAACPGLEGMTTEDNEHELDAAALVLNYLRKKPKKKRKRTGRAKRTG